MYLPDSRYASGEKADGRKVSGASLFYAGTQYGIVSAGGFLV